MAEGEKMLKDPFYPGTGGESDIEKWRKFANSLDFFDQIYSTICGEIHKEESEAGSDNDTCSCRDGTRRY